MIINQQHDKHEIVMQSIHRTRPLLVLKATRSTIELSSILLITISYTSRLSFPIFKTTERT